MLREVFSQHSISLLGLAVMVLFVAIFVMAIVWVFRKGSSDFYAEVSRLPLDTEAQPERRLL